jgi:hypothetical protein
VKGKGWFSRGGCLHAGKLHGLDAFWAIPESLGARRISQMMPMNLQDRAQYLSLALFAQKVVSALTGYVDENRSAKLKPSLTEAMNSLRHVDAKRPTVLPLGRLAAFTSYEHLRTVEEVWSAKERGDAIKMIRILLRSAPRDAEAKATAEKLIDLFSKLQDQALWNFEQPRPVSPKVMQRLCQLA